MSSSRQLAIVTGASTGIGLELAKCCAREGFDVLIAAVEPQIESAATEIRKRFGLEAAQTVLGHSKADVTQIYAERDHALAARVAREVG